MVAKLKIADLESDYVMEESAADERISKTPLEWIAYFNLHGKVMASMPDFYRAGKSENQKFIEDLSVDFFPEGLISSTRIRYKKG